MASSTVTSKGQTTIPAKIREFLKLSSGDRLEYIMCEDGKVMIMPLTLQVQALQGILPKPAKPVSLAAMEKAIHSRGGTHESP